MDKRYDRAINLSRLHEDLLAASIVPTLVEGMNTWARIVAPDATEAAVDAVVAAHDEHAQSINEAQTEMDDNALTAFIVDYGDMLERLDTIQDAMTAIKGRADTLAGLSTWSGLTTAQLGTRLQQVMPSIGTDLGTIATEFRAVAIGLENMLKALAVVHRRQSG